MCKFSLKKNFTYNYLNSDVKRRDNKANDRLSTQDDSKTKNQMSAQEGGDADAGNYKNFPEIPQKSVEVLTSKGYLGLFPIQQACFRPIYNKKDIIARDLTGSGKTVAFGLPTIERLRKEKLLRTGRVQAIMLAPTRELAI